MTDKVNSREMVLDILMEVLEKGGYSHVVLGQALEKYQFLEKQERAFITRTVNGTIEHLSTIDTVLNQYSKVKVNKMKPLVRTLLRMSVYQMVYLDRVPDSAVCNEAVKLAVKRKFSGLKGFVNGILRAVSRDKEELCQKMNPENLYSLEKPDKGDLSSFAKFLQKAAFSASLPPWLLELWINELGWEETKRTALAFFQEKEVSVRCNLYLASKEEITKSLEMQGVSIKDSPYSKKVLLLSGYDHLEGLEAFSRGWLQVQDISSVLAGEAALPKPGNFILDVCAAPGGKSLHMADMLAGTGMVEARDLTWTKKILIEENIRRTGFTNIRAVCHDALVPDPAMKEKADIVLADLPCSGLGIIGKKPDIKENMTPKSLNELAALQRNILSVVWQYVKPGGILVYSTCTIHRGENQENVEWFLSHYPFTAVDITEKFVPVLREPSMKEGWVQLLPGKHGCDGFFIAVFQRIS